MQSLNDLIWNDMFDDNEQEILDRINPIITGVISITCQSILSSCGGMRVSCIPCVIGSKGCR